METNIITCVPLFIFPHFTPIYDNVFHPREHEVKKVGALNCDKIHQYFLIPYLHMINLQLESTHPKSRKCDVLSKNVNTHQEN